MNRDNPQTPAPAEPAPAENSRATLMRERFRKSQLIAAQSARARAAGALPSDSEAARLVAEFHARGGQVTICPPAEETAPAAGPAASQAGQPATVQDRQDGKQPAGE